MFMATQEGKTRRTFMTLFQLSLGGLCGAGERQERDVQEVVGDDGQAAQEGISEEEDGDEEEGGGGAEVEEKVGEAGASWRGA